MRLTSENNKDQHHNRSRFSKWILSIGDWYNWEEREESIDVNIPLEFLIRLTGDPIATIVSEIYPDFVDNVKDPKNFNNHAILALTTDIVNKVNQYMLELMPGYERTYLNFNTPYGMNEHDTRPDDIHTPEFLNTITTLGILNHEIKLKIGVLIILLQNIDQSIGICNGTCLVITKMSTYVLEGQVISGTNIGQKVFIPGLSLTPSDNKIPFKFQRKQFPIALSFAMTINKSQGQSLTHVGLYIPRCVFSCGQLYVAVSKVTNKDGLRILITNEEGHNTDCTSNVVYKEVFRNLG